MTSLFTINACKTFGCRNLGLAASPDYIWPDYRLGYPALHCKACGSYPPLFNAAEFARWAAAYLKHAAREHGFFCPCCYQKETIHYGHHPGGSQRLQCQYCKKVWTPKQPRQVAAPTAICSVPLLLPFQGASASQQLYVLISVDAVRGNVLSVSSNFTPHEAGPTLRYRWRGIFPTPASHPQIMERVAMKERQFLQRSQFDEIQYGPAELKRNAKGAILRPVITAHGHFRALKARFPAVTTHIIAHECFLRGAVITAWAERFRQRQASLWFVEEERINESCTDVWQLRGKANQGWWQNQWQLWQQGYNQKMVCPLTESQREPASEISLATGHRFLRWLSLQTEFQHSARYSAQRVTQLLQMLADNYNIQRITPSSPS